MTAPCHGIELLNQKAFLDEGDAWDQLLQRSYDNRLFLTSAWHSIWWRHFGQGDAAIFATRSSEGGFDAILPLQVTDSDAGRTLTLLGDYNVSDYMDALALKSDAAELLRPLVSCALSDLSYDRIHIRHVPSNSPLPDVVQQEAREQGRAVIIEDDEVCPIAILCSSWDGYLQMLSKKQRHEIRRKMRRAQEGVEWEWRTVRNEADLARDLPLFFALHEASASDKARFMTRSMRDYFADLTAQALAANQLRLSVFRRDGEDLAATLSFLHRDRFLLYNSGYQPAYAAFSPGIAAVAHAMQDAIEEKAVAFDFLSGDEAYKYQFGAANTHTCRIVSPE